jgi:alcohol oxidase
MLIGTIAGDLGKESSITGERYFCIAPYIAYPQSRGSIHIASKSVLDEPKFHCGYLSSSIDVEILLWGYKKQREIARRMSCYGGPLKERHPVFPVGSEADYDVVDDESIAQGFPVPIKYSKNDDEAIRQYFREQVQTTWHSIGTCPMKSREAGGVVDSELNVYGVKGLKIVGKLPTSKLLQYW